MFRFHCPLCGAKPGPTPLREYLQSWANAPVERVDRLVYGLESALRQLHGGLPRWRRPSFLDVIDQVLRLVGIARNDLGSAMPGTPSGTEADGHAPDIACVVCGILSVEQEPDRYFTDWERACSVQTANLLYEMGLILWAIVREVPRWCDPATLAELDGLRRALRSASKAMNILECPICHRPTTHLYSTKRPFCRWCLDMSGGFGIGMTIKNDWTLELFESNPREAIVVDADLLPPTD